jgi:S-DNA-T family DNA segregation ATPase FtsK/SpoIIIE
MKKKKAKKEEEELDEMSLFDDRNFLEKHNIQPDKLFAIFLVAFCVFSFSSLFGLAGSLGGMYFTFMTDNLGLYSYFTPFAYLFFAFVIFTKKWKIFLTVRFWSFVVLLCCIFILLGAFQIDGRLGNGAYNKLQNSFGSIPTIFLLGLTTILTLFRIFETSILEVFAGKFNFGNEVRNTKKVLAEEVTEFENQVEELLPEKSPGFLSRLFSFGGNKNNNELQVNHLDGLEEGFENQNQEDEYEEIEVEEEAPVDTDVRTSMYEAAGVKLTKEEKEKVKVTRLVKKEVPEENQKTKKENIEKIRQLESKYDHPPLSMYTEDSGKSSAGDNKENARIIKRTLADFGISVEMDEVTVGPTVTRYALKPAQGVKIEKIMNLANNIALELGVSSVSITRVHERSLIGIEVPNKQKSKLGIGSLFSTREFGERKDKLTLAFGKDIYGEPVFADMTKMPHLLVAGTTGAGKSVLVHGLINSLIFKNSPYDLKFILVDPKKVEFALYSNLPHLYTPVIKDPKKAIQTLNWLVQEMDRRYQVLEDCGKQNIASYHQFVFEKYKRAEGKTDSSQKLPERMPYIVLVIDELADFMMKYPKEMESGIVKLAQMSRAVGIHLILATQRPSTNVITGVIKGNIPSRVALRVASQVDSRVIIDQGGAEKLLGYGDLLLQSSDNPDLKRIQSPNVTEEEIKEVVAYLRSKYDDVTVEDLKMSDGNIVGATNLNPGMNSNSGPISDSDFNSDDDKYEDAKAIVIQTGKTSISNLQVRLGTGYARSAKLINMLESAGVIITTTDNNGKQIKTVAGKGNQQQVDSEKLEKQADKMLESGKVEDDADEEIEEENQEKEKAGGFFRF